MARADGRTITSNTCAGDIPKDPMRFTVRSGDRFVIEIGHEESGVLDFPIPAPTGGGIRRLNRHGATITYQARSPGTTKLIARHTRYCATHAGAGYATCTAAVIHVTPP